MPALTRFGIRSVDFRQVYRAGTFQPIIQTLYRKIGLQNLEYALFQCQMGDVVFSDLLAAFEGSGSAKRLTNFTFCCDIGVEGARALADVIGRDVFPALDSISLYDNPKMSDEGVIVLAEALVNASGLFLKKLELVNIGMCDRGIAALASVVRQGRLERLEELHLSNNKGVTDDGIITLTGTRD